MANRRQGRTPLTRRADALGRLKARRHGTRGFTSWLPEADVDREPHFNPAKRIKK